MSRLILIGLPGSGKTTLGRMAAQALALPFYDCDDRASRAAGMTIPDIFARRGEPYFRALEREALQELCRREDCIIATGGGQEDSIKRTIDAGANAISYTPPTTKELFSTMMDDYRNRE